MGNLPKENINVVKDILEDEIKGDIDSALKKMDKNYSMSWAYKHPKTGELFPKIDRNILEEMEKVYVIKGRKYDIKNILANDTVVMVEMIESYPDPKTGKLYQTPQVIVLEMKDKKILKGRHYCDPNVSYLDLSDEDLNSIY